MLDQTLNRRRLTRKAAIFTSIAALLCLVPLAALRAPAQDIAGPFTGSVLDPSGVPVPSATVIIIQEASHTRAMTATDASGAFRFEALPAGDYDLRVLRNGFPAFYATQRLESARAAAQTVTLRQDAAGTLLGEKKLAEQQAAGQASNLHPETGSAASNYEQKLKAERALAPAVPDRIRVGANIQKTNLISQIHPVYPAAAKNAGVQGPVILAASIDREGVPLSLTVVNQPDPELARAAIEAVSQWRYRPTLLNGEPIAVETNITVNFTLAP